METKRKNIMTGSVAVILCACVGIGVTPDTAVADVEEVELQKPIRLSVSADEVPSCLPPWMTDGNGYNSIFEYNKWEEDKTTTMTDVEGLTDSIIEKYSQYVTEEEKEQLYAYERKMLKSKFINDYKQYEEEMNALIDSIQERVPAPMTVYNNSGQTVYNNNATSGVLTKSGGVNQFNGHTETWYSQRDLPGGGLNIPGRHVREDGVIVDGEGYVVVATPQGATGEVVMTSLGVGRAYDMCPAGNYDIYTDW